MKESTNQLLVIPMDALQVQMVELDRKVDRLNEVVERLSNQITVLTTDQSQSEQERDSFSFASQNASHSATKVKNGHFSSVMEHKDILLDDGNGKNNINPKNEQSLSPDLQIRRLTAQLTAAYNRIAALEEQLLACRVKP
jgi:TolA-binding protein